MIWPRKKPDRGDGPAPGDDGKDVTTHDSGSSSGRWVRVGKWERDHKAKTKHPRGRVYHCRPGTESIRIDHLIVGNNRLQAWVELRRGQNKVPVVWGWCDDMSALEAYEPFLKSLPQSPTPWRDGLRLAFYETLVELSDQLTTVKSEA